MKKLYEEPVMMCDTFKVDEYVAACGEGGITYKIKCNVEGGILSNTTGINGIYSSENIWSWKGNHVACTAEFEVDAEQLEDWYIYDEGSVLPGDEKWVPVKVWEENGVYHHTTDVDASTWEILFS